MYWNPVTLVPLLTVFYAYWTEVLALDCYECYSYDNSDANCSDPFHPAYGHLTKGCTQRKTGIFGSFPAKFCVKLIGTATKDGVEMVFRGCSLESLESQCGDFKVEETRYKGCVTSCEEDGCNGALTLSPWTTALWIVPLCCVLNLLQIIQFRL